MKREMALLTKFSGHLAILFSSAGAWAGLLPVQYPTSINNPNAYVAINIPNGSIIGNCQEGGGEGSYQVTNSVTRSGRVVEEIRFDCSVRIVDLGKRPKYSPWWNLVLKKNDSPLEDGDISVDGLRLIARNGGVGTIGGGYTINFSSAFDGYGSDSGARMSRYSVLVRTTGYCTRYLGGSVSTTESCDLNQFKDTLSKLSKIVASNDPQKLGVYLKQNTDKSLSSRYPCVGSSFPGACTKSEGGPYGQCLEYGPPTQIPASPWIDCSEIR